MARITVEDALEQVKNRFALTMLAAQRARQLFRGSKPLSLKKSNREVVTALREVAEEKVKFAHPELFQKFGSQVVLTRSKEKDKVIALPEGKHGK